DHERDTGLAAAGGVGLSRHAAHSGRGDRRHHYEPSLRTGLAARSVREALTMGQDPTGAPPHILIHSDRAHLFTDAIRSSYAGAVLAECSADADIGTALASARPEIVLSHKFERGPYPGQDVVACDSVRWIHAGGTGVDHFQPWDPGRIVVTN